MNILYLFHYAGTPQYGMMYRPYHLGKEWVKQGHNVTIVGASYSHVRMKQPVVNKDFDEEFVEGIRYIWMKTPSYNSSIKRIINIICFVRKLNKYSKRLCDMTKPDIVIASSTYPLDNYPAHKIAKLSGAKYCYEVHDLWPLSPMLIGGYSPKHPFIRVMQRAEDYAYKHVDKVVSLLWNAEEHMREHGLAKGKYICVPNGYDPDYWTEEKRNLPLPEIHQKTFDSLTGKLIVGFAGGFAASGAVINLIETAAVLKENNNIQFVLVGKGMEEQKLKDRAIELNLNNVTFLPAVSKELVPAVNSHFDIAYMGGTHSKLHYYGTAFNKMTDYMLSEKPIVQAIDEPNSVIEKVGCGVQIEAENPKDAANAILKIAQMPENDRLVMGKKGREYVENNLKWEKLATTFINAF